MTTEEANPSRQQAIIESIRVARRSEESARMHVNLSLPVKGAEQLLPFLAASLKNPVLVSFDLIQARLPEGSVTITGPNQDVPTVEVLTTVDGAEAKVILPVREGGRRNAILPHPYKDDTGSKGKCVYCKHGAAYTAHDQARIDAAARAKANGSNGNHAAPERLVPGPELVARLEEAGKTPHAFVKPELADDAVLLDDGCYLCGQMEDSKTHLEAEALSGVASKLIEQAQETDAVPA